jgi:hypothetical protein
MKSSTIRWHLARDNKLSLHKFLSSNAHVASTTQPHKIDDGWYYEKTYEFDNGSIIEVELRAGDTKRGYNIDDHFQVVRTFIVNNS